MSFRLHGFSGENVIIDGFRGGRKLRQRLLDLGLNQGARVRVIKNEMHGR